MFERDKICRIDYVESFGSQEIKMVALFHKDRVSEEAVNKSITTDTYNKYVVIMTEEQFKNVFR